MQMLRVAFSRRMCCSRVAGPAAGPGSPCASLRYADQPARHLALERVPGGKKAACGPPNPIGTPKRCAEPTATSAPNSPGGAKQRQREEVRGHDASRAPAAWARAKNSREIVNRAGRVRILDKHAEASRTGLEAAVVAHDHLDAERLGPGQDDVDRLRVAGR